MVSGGCPEGSEFSHGGLVMSQNDLLLVELTAQAGCWTGDLVNRGRRALCIMTDARLHHELL